MRRILMITLLIFVAGSLTGCSDGESEVEPFFQVTIEVEDEAGKPVPGLNLELTSDNPYLQDRKGDKARATIEFSVPRATRVRLVVEDITGAHIRNLIDGILMAGRHQFIWDAKNDEGIHQPSGRYTIRMIGYDPESGGPEFEDTIDVLMCLIDPFHQPIGVTDENGQVIITDKRHFPHLYDREPMMAYEEIAEPQGLLEPTADMIITLGDTNGGAMLFRDEIPGRGTYRFVWTRNRVTTWETGKMVEEPEFAMSPPLPEWKLGPAYPNPFN